VGRLYFDYVDYNYATPYYRKGIALTATSVPAREMLLPNFALFQKAVNEKNLNTYIPSLLLLLGSFFISDEALAKLEEDETMASFFQKYGYHWENNVVSSCWVVPVSVLASIDAPHSDEELFSVIKALLRMRAKAQAPNRISYDAPKELSKFVKEVLQRS